MLRALYVGGVLPYTPIAERDKPETDRTTFFLKVPSERAMRAIENALEPHTNPGAQTVRQETATAVRFALLYCLRGWERFTTHDDCVLEFSKAIGAPDDYKGPEGDEPIRGVEKAIDYIPHELREELFLKIRELGTVSPPN